MPDQKKTVATEETPISQHYKGITPEPMEIIQSWGLTDGFVCGTILKLVARIYTTNRTDAPTQPGYNNRGSSEDIQKLRYYVDRLEEWVLEREKARNVPPSA